MSELRFVTPAQRIEAASRPDPAVYLVKAPDAPREWTRRVPGAMCSRCAVRPVHARGFCHSCYRTSAPRKPCLTPGCNRKRDSQGLCTRCYQSGRAKGTVVKVQQQNVPAEDRFWAYVAPVNAAGCRLWTSQSKGQARFTDETGTSVQASYFAWRLVHGSYPDTTGPEVMRVDKMCRQSKCVEASHLELVTAVENNRRVRVWGGKTTAQMQDASWLELAENARLAAMS